MQEAGAMAALEMMCSSMDKTAASYAQVLLDLLDDSNLSSMCTLLCDDVS